MSVSNKKMPNRDCSNLQVVYSHSRQIGKMNAIAEDIYLMFEYTNRKTYAIVGIKEPFSLLNRIKEFGLLSKAVPILKDRKLQGFVFSKR